MKTTFYSLNTNIASIFWEQKATVPAAVDANQATNLRTSSIGKDGYKVITIVPAYSSKSGVLAQGCSYDRSNNTAVVAVKNITSEKTNEVIYYVNVYYIKI